MLKFRRIRAGFSLFILTCIALGGGVIDIVQADDISDWLDSTSISLEKEKDISLQEIPTTTYGTGNTDCSIVYGQYCSIDTPYGTEWGSSIWVGDKWRAVEDYNGNSSIFMAIPGSDTSITTSSALGFGRYMYFTDNISSTLSPQYSGASLSYFKLSRNYDRKLADKSGKPLIADTNSVGFSGNSRWMVATLPNLAEVRVNISNGEVLPYGPRFTYGSGNNPRTINAISSDGRYAFVSDTGGTYFNIYDLSTCAAVPDNITGPAYCAEQNLMPSGFIQKSIPGYSGTFYARFLNDDTLSFYAGHKVGNVTKFGQYTLSAAQSGINKLQYLALGDSYISGEGAFKYQAGTDTSSNHCHTSLLSYPYLLGYDLNFDSYHTVACSGAVTADILDQTDSYAGQTKLMSRSDLERSGGFEKMLDSFSPGYIDQLEFVKKYQPAAITVSVGGNDMGFSKILLRCLEPDTCYSSYEDRVEIVRQIDSLVYPRLTNTYQQLKKAAPNSRIYVAGYPRIVKPGGDCSVNVRLDSNETAFASMLIDYLNQAIAAAAAKSGAAYVDVSDALEGYRLCEGRPGSIAMNGITAGNDRLMGTIGAETYHPNAFGHSLLEQAILAATDELTEPMPSPKPTLAYPSAQQPEILNAPRTNRLINSLYYDDDMTNDTVYRGGEWDITVSGFGIFKPLSKIRAELHSDPVHLGEFTADQNGNLTAQISQTNEVTAGFHTLHVYGTNVANQPVDIYKVVYVADSPTSLTPSDDNPCVVFPASGQDYDKDGIDDACDGNIGAAPIQSDSGGQSGGQTGDPPALTPGIIRNPGSVDAINSPARTVITNTQGQNNLGEIATAVSEGGGAPAVLAAKTENHHKTLRGRTHVINPGRSFKYRIAAALCAAAGCVYAIRRFRRSSWKSGGEVPKLSLKT